jgi:DNA-directed RNA polymerase specialized sigma24 family protein
MKKQWDTTQESFDQLLSWLDNDRDQAARKYELIRRRLIKIFTCRGCVEAEDLADETINRVTSKVAEIASNYEGEPALYFYGVARKVHQEYLRPQNKVTPPLTNEVSEDDDENVYQCLDRCMETVTETSRQVVLRYYENEKKAKIDDRKALADELGIGVNALRIRAHRIRLLLRKCVTTCMEQLPVN